ncbi:unnamed protein product [Phaeothamnion confervicola]
MVSETPPDTEGGHVLRRAVVKNTIYELSLSLTLAQDALGRPKFFHACLVPAEENVIETATSV